MILNGNAITAITDGVKETMMSEEQIKILLDDIKSVYMVGYFKEDLTTEAEKWGQIQILEYILLENKNA
jgi:hypothetical protein